MEAINFLYKSLIADAGKIPYTPHLPKYWSPQDLFYTRDIGKNIELGLGFEFYKRRSKRAAYFFKLSIIVRYGLVDETIAPVEYVISYNDGETIIRVSNDSITVSLSEELYNKYRRRLVIDYKKVGSMYTYTLPLGLPKIIPLLLYKIPILVGTAYLRDYIFVYDIIPITEKQKVNYNMS